MDSGSLRSGFSPTGAFQTTPDDEYDDYDEYADEYAKYADKEMMKMMIMILSFWFSNHRCFADHAI